MQANNAKWLENLAAHVQVMAIRTLNLHGSASVMTGETDPSGICPGDAPLQPSVDRLRVKRAVAWSFPRRVSEFWRYLPGSRIRPQRSVTRLALARRRPPGIALSPVTQMLTLSVCIAIVVRASAPQQLNNLGNILLSTHFLGSSFNYVSGSWMNLFSLDPWHIETLVTFGCLQSLMRLF